MHELSVCQALLAQVDDIARAQNAIAVYEINVDVGPLSGVVPQLLAQAFTLARAGTLAQAAELVVNEPPVTVRCQVCERETNTTTNALCCAACGDWRTTVIHGDELMLRDVVLERAPDIEPRRTHHV